MTEPLTERGRAVAAFYADPTAAVNRYVDDAIATNLLLADRWETEPGYCCQCGWVSPLHSFDECSFPPRPFTAGQAVLRARTARVRGLNDEERRSVLMFLCGAAPEEVERAIAFIKDE